MHMEVTCAVTATRLPSGEALKLVQSPEGRWVPDLKQVLPVTTGSCYLLFSWPVLQQAIAQDIVQGGDLPVLVERQLLAQALGALGLAKRSGQVLAGHEKVLAAMEHPQRWGCLIHAADAAADGMRKITRRKPDEMPEIRCLTREQLTQATGIANPVHLLVKAGALADRVAGTCAQLENWRREN